MSAANESHALRLGAVRQVGGNAIVELNARAFAELRARYQSGLVLDLGTGDGKHVRAEARRRPDALVVGLDASVDAMRHAAARASAKPRRGGAPNALFVWAPVEQLPAELDGVTEVHALMPWGSLLRALVAPDEGVLSLVAQRCATAATFLITLNLRAWRPPVPEVGGTAEPTPESALAELAPAYARAGWILATADYLNEPQIAQLSTSWTKRLGAQSRKFDVLALRGTIG